LDRISNLLQQSLIAIQTPDETLEAIIEPAEIFTGDMLIDRVFAVIMAPVGIDPDWQDRYPHEFSGRLRQRISITRALVVDPEFILADEPIAALDLSIQAQILNLMMDLQEQHGLTDLFISRDLSVVKHIADEVMVMYLGKAVEFASRDIVFKMPRHPYTKALLSATPVADPFRTKERIMLRGELPSPIAPPPGCPFHPRCPEATERC
jgi:dipeptide transport system ATP-binding protein